VILRYLATVSNTLSWFKVIAASNTQSGQPKSPRCDETAITGAMIFNSFNPIAAIDKKILEAVFFFK
jgi:hypothetical protein